MDGLHELAIKAYSLLNIVHEVCCEILETLSMQHKDAERETDPGTALANILRHGNVNNITSLEFLANRQKIFNNNEIKSRIEIRSLDLFVICELLTKMEGFPTQGRRLGKQLTCADVNHSKTKISKNIVCCTHCNLCSSCALRTGFSCKFATLRSSIDLWKNLCNVTAHSTVQNWEEFKQKKRCLGDLLYKDWNQLWSDVMSQYESCLVFLVDENKFHYQKKIIDHKVFALSS